MCHLVHNSTSSLDEPMNQIQGLSKVLELGEFLEPWRFASSFYNEEREQRDLSFLDRQLTISALKEKRTQPSCF